MAVGHRGQRAENAGSSGALSPRTMTVTITANTASEYAASRCAVTSFFTHTRSLESSWSRLRRRGPHDEHAQKHRPEDKRGIVRSDIVNGQDVAVTRNPIVK